MKSYIYKPSARPPDREEVPILDAIATEILENLVLKGELVPLTSQKERYYVEQYKLREPSADYPDLRSS